MLLTILIAVLAASLLLFAGYLLGVNRGVQSREYLRAQLQLLQPTKIPKQALPEDCLGPLANMFSDPENLLKAESTSAKAGCLQLIGKRREVLAHLMNDIAESACFKTVLLSDENGLPLAASRQAADLGRLAAISGYVVILGEHIRREEDYRPVSLLFNDINKNQVLSRVFMVGGQRLVLTGLAGDDNLSLEALDSALSKVLLVLDSE